MHSSRASDWPRRRVTLAARVSAAASDVEAWDRRARGFRELGDGDLEVAREALHALAERLERLVTEVASAAPDDMQLISTAHIARRKARHDEVWAEYVLHMRRRAQDPDQTP